MPRNMSFALTTDQIRDRTKTVTRRDGWLKAKPGDRVRPVLKCMGLKKGECVTPILPSGWLIEFTSVRRERLEEISQEDVVREGFPEMSPVEFCVMYRKHGDRADDGKVARIEFRYVEVNDGLPEVSTT